MPQTTTCSRRGETRLVLAIGTAAFAPALAAWTGQPAVRFAWSAFGFSFAVFIATTLLAAAVYRVLRSQLLLHPGVTTQRYAAAVAVLAAFYGVMTVLENELLGPDITRLPYEALPLTAAILWLHVKAYRTQEPADILAGIAFLLAGAAVAAAVTGTGVAQLRPAQWVAVFAGLVLGLYTLGRNARSQRAFAKGSSAVVANRLPSTGDPRAGKPWFSLGQGVLIALASVSAALLLQIGGGRSLASLLFIEILSTTGLILAITAAASLVPAAIYRWRQGRRMPDFVWLVWLVWATAAFGTVYFNLLLGR